MYQKSTPCTTYFRQLLYVTDSLLMHPRYLAQADTTQHVVIRGTLLVDGRGNQNSYCTCIQENLRALHFNCTYVRSEGKIWIMQTATILANEELSIQYAKDGSYWSDRAGDYPPELYALACTRYMAYSSPVPKCKRFRCSSMI
jgi:hypothetical protein